jgi:dTDP-4-dehydrorhamnose 3,5-epimerase
MAAAGKARSSGASLPLTCGAPRGIVSGRLTPQPPRARSVTSAVEAPPAVRVEGRLADGIRVRPLLARPDDRGSLTEVFRQSWKGGGTPVQWNVVASEPRVLRGVHVHLGYDEAYVLLRGRLTVGYRDVRPGSPTEGAVALVEVRGAAPCVVFVPPGVAHGLLFHEPSLLLIGVTEYWDLKNELGCHWLDPDLAIPWPRKDVRLSSRDASLPPLRTVLPRVPRWRGSPGAGARAE